MTALEQIKQEINNNEVVLFMKGTPSFPQCGFSAAVIQILTDIDVKFKTVDVLEEPLIRDEIKRYSDWPTIPQLYIRGEFVGGCDIVREMYKTNELAELLESDNEPVIYF